MFEMLVKPKRAERRPWEMFFVGLFYASLSFGIVSILFSSENSVFQGGLGLLIVLFTLICCLPFMYYIIKLEEGKDVQIDDSGRLIKEHSKAIHALIWLFLGFVVAFSVGYLAFPENAGQNFNFQIKAFCAINSPSSYNACLKQYGVPIGTGSGSVSEINSFLRILTNNIHVLIFTLVFSLIFGAGAIFILIWNASVISAAIGIFAQGNLTNLPQGLIRYMIHGVPEIAAYFVGALAGGIVSVAIIRKDLRGDEMTWKILQDALVLVLIAIIILFVAALMEVYITPALI